MKSFIHNHTIKSVAVALATGLVAAAPVQAVSLPAEATGAPSINESVAAANTFYVSPTGNDNSTTATGNYSTQQRIPFKTVQKGVDAALLKKNAGISTKVVMASGTYREDVTVPDPASNDTNATLIIQAEAARGAVISGSEEVKWTTGWQTETSGVSNGVFKHNVSYRFPLGADGYAISGSGEGGTFSEFTRQSLIRRREMVFFNGLTLRQVFTQAELSDPAGDATFYIGGIGEGNFSATGTRNTLYINPPGDVTLSQLNVATLQFAVRGFALKVVNRKNVVLRGLVCQHATHYQTQANGGGLLILGETKDGGSQNILIDNCNARWNNGRGLILSYDGQNTYGVNRDNNNITVRGSTLNYNGVQGIKIRRAENLLVEDCETSTNNWRGSWGDSVSGWEPGGFKASGAHRSTWVRHTAVGNWGRGMWWDTDNTDIIARNCFMKNNHGSGLFVEYSQGPALVEDCIITATKDAANDGGGGVQDAGLNVSSSWDVTLRRNICYNNSQRQFGLWVIKRGEFADQEGNGVDYETGILLTIEPERHVVGDGTYREEVSIPMRAGGVADTDKALIIEAAPGAAPVISGSNEKTWGTGWLDEDSIVNNGVYKHSVSYRFPIGADGYAVSGSNGGEVDGGNFPEGERQSLIRRREMVFFNDLTLRQVFTLDEVKDPAGDGTFYLGGNPAEDYNLSGTRNTLYINPPGEITNISQLWAAKLEFAVRPHTLVIQERKNVVLRGLIFQHATHYQNEEFGASVILKGPTGCQNVLIDRCRARWNNGRGMLLAGGSSNENVTLRNTSLNWNGVQGLKARRIKNLRVEDCETNNNNWRGQWAAFVSGWEPGGFKISFSRRTTLIRHTSIGNWGRGMWWDTDNTDITARNCFMKDNTGSGLFVEYNQGPSLVEDCIIVGTRPTDAGGYQDAGLNVSASRDVTLKSNICYNNAKRQFGLWNITRGIDGAVGTNYENGQTLIVAPEYHTYSNNVFLATGTQAVALFPDKTDQASFYSTSISNPNCFFAPSGSQVFESRKVPSGAITLRNLAGWKTYSTLEDNSLFAAPVFHGPANDDFNLTDSSPIPLGNWSLPTGPLSP